MQRPVVDIPAECSGVLDQVGRDVAGRSWAGVSIGTTRWLGVDAAGSLSEHTTGDVVGFLHQHHAHSLSPVGL